MKKEIIIKDSSIRFLSIILFFIPTIILFTLSYLKSSLTINLDINLILHTLLLFIAITISHELLHATGFILFGNLNIRDLKIKNTTSSLLPYISSSTHLNKWSYLAMLFFPGLILGSFTILLFISNLNIFYLFLVGYSISICAGDFLLGSKILLVQGNHKIFNLEDRFGVVISEI